MFERDLCGVTLIRMIKNVIWFIHKETPGSVLWPILATRSDLCIQEHFRFICPVSTISLFFRQERLQFNYTAIQQAKREREIKFNDWSPPIVKVRRWLSWIPMHRERHVPLRSGVIGDTSCDAISDGCPVVPRQTTCQEGLREKQPQNEQTDSNLPEITHLYKNCLNYLTAQVYWTLFLLSHSNTIKSIHYQWHKNQIH